MDLNRILHLISNNDLGNVNMIKNHMRTKPCLVFMVAPWCGHCQKLEPTINTLEKDLVKEPEFDPFSIMKIHDEYLPKVNLKAKSYPTIRLFINGKHITDHEGDREPDDIKDFLRNNMKHISRNSMPVKKKCNMSRYSKPSMIKSDGPLDRLSKSINNSIKTFKIRKHHKKPRTYRGKGSKDPKWVSKVFGIQHGGNCKCKKCVKKGGHGRTCIRMPNDCEYHLKCRDNKTGTWTKMKRSNKYKPDHCKSNGKKTKKSFKGGMKTKRRRGMKKTPSLKQQIKSNPWMKEILYKKANGEKLNSYDKSLYASMLTQPLPSGAIKKLLRMYKK
jgi:thiol-disulfide isomerase/thioredoxin